MRALRLSLLVVLLAAGCPKDAPQESASASASASTTTSTTDASSATGSSTSAASTTATNSTSTTAATSTTAESTSTGCLFLECDDTSEPPETCDVWAQDCPEGHKCMPYANDGGNSWNALDCFPVDRDPDAVGEPCTVEESGVSGVDSCDATSMCFNVNAETLEGTCFAFCTGSHDEPTCDQGSSCNLVADGVLILCYPLCDPLAQDCSGGDLCLFIGQYPMCFPDASGDAGAFGDPCEYANACDPGLVCLNPAYVDGCRAYSCCTPFCDTSAPNTCPGDGQECIPWYNEGQAPEGLENVGVCGVPQ